MWIQTAASDRSSLDAFLQREYSDDFYKAVQQTIKSWQSQEYVEFKSSGSTGAPKLLKFHKNIVQQSVAATLQHLGIQPSDGVFLITLHPQYTGGRMMVLRAMENRANIVLIPPSSGWIGMLPSHIEDIDLCALTPMQLHVLLEAPRPVQHKFKNILIGGAGLNPATRTKLSTMPFRAYETFGMTETVSHFALKLIGVDAHFRLLPGYSIRLNAHHCLEVAGPATEGVWIATNDMVLIHTHNTFEWLGRSDFVINSGGVKLHPETLENSIRDLLEKEHIQLNFALSAVADAQLGEMLVLVYENTSSPPDMEFVLATLKQKLPPYSAPKQLIAIEKLPLTPNGKTDRLLLKQILKNEDLHP